MADGLRRASAEQLDIAVKALTSLKPDEVKAVHAARLCLKRLRATLRLAEQALGDETYAAENHCFRKAGRRLGASRDAAVALRTLGMVTKEGSDWPRGGQMDRVQAALEARRDEASATSEVHPKGVHPEIYRVVADLAEARARVSYWSLPEGGFELLEPGLRTTYNRARRQFMQAYRTGSAETLHEWRKSHKYLWYQLELLERVWPRLMKAHRREMSALADLLGDHHDLVVFEAILADLSVDDAEGAIGQLREIAAKMRSAIVQRAQPLGERLYAETPAQFVKRIATYWDTWHTKAEVADALKTEQDAPPATPRRKRKCRPTRPASPPEDVVAPAPSDAAEQTLPATEPSMLDEAAPEGDVATNAEGEEDIAGEASLSPNVDEGSLLHALAAAKEKLAVGGNGGGNEGA